MNDTYKLHVLICHAFSPILLHPNTKITIGREQENSIILNDELVSRFHSFISIDEEGQAFLEDRGSRNGTLLNDQRILNRSLLKTNDKIIIGSHCLFYKDLETHQQEELATDNFGSTTLGVGQLTSHEGMKGSLDHMDFTELLLSLECHTKTGVLAIRGEDDVDATLDIKEGNIFRARYKNLKNIEAIYALIPLKAGTFQFTNRDLKNISREISLSPQQILLEYARTLHEQH
ncbi:MAG: FHA domain-containing protein [Planctomycetota bacterium]